MTGPFAPGPEERGAERPSLFKDPQHEPFPLREPEPEPEPRWQYEIDAERKAQRRAERRERLRNIGGPFGFTLLALWKVGRIVLVALGKVALLFKIPLLGTVFSGAISIGAYSVFFGWSFAIGLVLSLLVHELGHVVAVKREGMPVKALNFVPFFGAYVLSEVPPTADAQARISIAGPLAGALLAALIAVVAGDDPMLEAIAYTGFFLNLLNLLPVGFLDGGGVATVFTAGWWLLVAAALGVIALASGQEFAAVLAIVAVVMAVIHRGTGLALDPRPDPPGPALPGAPQAGVPVRERARAAILYAVVVGICAAGMSATFRDRHDELIDRYGSAPVVLSPIGPA